MKPASNIAMSAAFSELGTLISSEALTASAWAPAGPSAGKFSPKASFAAAIYSSVGSPSSSVASSSGLIPPLTSGFYSSSFNSFIFSIRSFSKTHIRPIFNMVIVLTILA